MSLGSGGKWWFLGHDGGICVDPVRGREGYGNSGEKKELHIKRTKSRKMPFFSPLNLILPLFCPQV